MAITKISKINIIASLQNQEKIVEAIQDFGVMQIEEHDDESLPKSNITELLNDIEYKLAGVKFSLNFLSEYDTGKKSLAEKFNLKIELTKEELKEKVENFNFKIFKEVQEVQRIINEARNITEKTKEEIKQLSAWKNLNFTPSSKNFPSKINFKLLSLSFEELENLKNQINKKLPLSELQIVEENKKELKASLIYHINCNDALLEILNSLNIKTEEIPEIDVSIPEYLDKLKNITIQQNKILEEEKQKAHKLTKKIKDLKIIFDYLTWQRDRLLAQQKTIKGWQFFSAIGWIEKEKIKILEKKLSAITNKFFIEEIKPEKDEQIPIALKNSWWASPFEFVTGIYGPPKNGSPDPTPFLAPFFVLFFGLCLTDAGYGVILALLAWIGIKLTKPKKEAKKIFLVLMYGGLMTFVAGALVGGWFGIVIDDLGNGGLKNLLTGMRVIDPVKDPITMLLFSLALGVAQIFTGIIISIWWKIKNHDLKSALLDDAMWLYFLTVMLIWGANKFGVIDLSVAKYFVWLGVAGIIISQGRKAKNPILKLVTGVISLYGLVGYLSDVLSYSRLLALGLATGIIAMVVNLIAALTIEMIPYLGYVIALAIIIGGHIFNIAINALGSFIHASRLQFVEFFPKFMEGGGSSLSPVKKESKYTKII